VSGSRRRTPHTLLDRLVSEKVIRVSTAAKLRDWWKDLNARDPDEPLTPVEHNLAVFLLARMMMPAQPESANVHMRAYWIAFECAYRKAIGHQSHTQETATAWNVSVKTVSNASRQHQVQFSLTKISPELSEKIRRVRNAYEAADEAADVLAALKATDLTPEKRKFWEVMFESIWSEESTEDALRRAGLGNKMH
jgi:hypothetical protein